MVGSVSDLKENRCSREQAYDLTSHSTSHSFHRITSDSIFSHMAGKRLVHGPLISEVKLPLWDHWEGSLFSPEANSAVHRSDRS